MLPVCTLLLIILPRTLSQYYSPDYRVSDDLEDHEGDHGGYRSSGGHDSSSEVSGDTRPDYSKYYQHDGASASFLGPGGNTGFLQESKDNGQGFVTPLDFSGFFSTGHFGAASNQQQSQPVIPVQNPFYFNDGLKSQNSSGFVDANEFNNNFHDSPNVHIDIGKQFAESSFEPKPDNTYVAPKKNSYKKSQSYKSEADDLNKYEKPKKKYKKYEKPKSNYYYKPVSPTLSSYTPNINQLAPVKTYVPQLFPAPKYTNTQSTLSPKYSFQPSINIPTINTYKSTLPPLNNYNLASANAYDYISPTEIAQPSEKSYDKVQNSNCQQIKKQLSPEDISHGRFKRQADKMNCYLCKDPKSGGTYEQCSYTSDPDNDQSYFRGHAEKYSTKTYVDPDEHSKRRRRETKKDRRNKRKRQDEEDHEEYVNPFDYKKKSSHKFNSKPEEFDDSESYYQAPDFSNYEKDAENYRFGPEYFTDSTNEEKSYSEQQSEQLKKDGENCKKIKKDSMTCMVCSNPKTGGNYEQCSYSSEPQEKKYAYVKEKKYSSNDEPEEKTVESTENKPTNLRQKSRYSHIPIEYSASNKNPKVKQRKETDDYHIPRHHYRAESKQKKRYDKSESAPEDKNKHDDYVYKLFPEYAEKESKNREVKQRPGFEYKSDLPEYFTAEESKKDVDSVLQEFSKKDRSKCKKIAKDKMTCYLCIDDKGVQHEECMFVSESQPKSSHIAYHEVKEFSSDPKRQSQGQNEGQTVQETKQSAEIHPSPRRKNKKASPASLPLKTIKEVDAEPTEYVKVVGKTPRIVRRKSNISKEYLGSLPQESRKREVKVKPKTKESIESTEEEEVREPDAPESAFASELVPVFSKELGVTLPKYMLDISEGEKIFDQVVKSG